VRSLGLLGVVAGALALTALVSPVLAYGLAALLGHQLAFARVYDRVFEIVLAAILLLAWRRLDLGQAVELGFRRLGAARDLGRGLAAGVAGLAVALGLCALLGALVPALRFSPAKTVRKACLGAAAALAIGVGEEALFRGVLLRRLTRDGGRGFAVVVTTVVYAAVHLIRTRGGGGPVDAWSGIRLTLALFAPLLDPLALPQLVGLLALGALLAVARLRTGALWLPIGVHAAFVAVFRVGRLFFVVRPAPAWLVGTGWPPLVGGVAGWVAVAVAALLALRPRARAVCDDQPVIVPSASSQ